MQGICDVMKMKCSPEVCCIVCHLVFCCEKCRWRHEKNIHGLLFDCPICRGNRFLCNPEDLNNELLDHLSTQHLPLQCRKCNQIFNTMEDLTNVNKCVSISELIDKNVELKDVNEKFDSIYERAENDYEAIVLVNKSTKTAIITPIVRRKCLVDYESSDTEEEELEEEIKTPHGLVPKTPKLKRQRAATPHAKKFLHMMRQNAEDHDESAEDCKFDGSPVTNKTTPLRNDEPVPDMPNEMTTPTSHMHIAKLVQVVTTSTPTHPATPGWALFTDTGADSPLSEIENSESPAQSITEPSKEGDTIPRKLKSIIVTGSRIRLGSQDSSEKQVTFQDSVNTDTSSVRTKRVKFAEDTVFEQEPKVKRVFRKPKRMLTPGPQKPRFCCNPRFQALINRFEQNGLTRARTPVNIREEDPKTPTVGEPMQARAINFKDDSPIVDSKGDYSKESNELFKTCVDSPLEPGVNQAITSLTATIAGSLQNCLTSVLKTTEEETEIQFKFVITKRKVTVNRLVDTDVVEKASEIQILDKKENIWSTVANAVKNVFWGEQSLVATPHHSYESHDTTTSSASKRKIDDISDAELSPLNHKRHKYEGRIMGRPPLRRGRTWVSNLRPSHSAEQQTLLSAVSNHDDGMNQSF